MCPKQKDLKINIYYSIIMASKYVDHLTEDKPIPGQEWVCISFLSPEGIRNCSVRGLKIRGVYATKKEAEKRAKELQLEDPDHNIFIGTVGKWLPWDPDVNSVEDQVYKEKELNELAKGYKENIARVAEVEKQRKAELLEKAAKEEQVKSMRPVDKKRYELQKKLEASKQQKEETLVDKGLKEEEEKLNTEKAQLSKVKTEIDEKTKTVNEYDAKLSKITELYNKLNKQ